MCGETQEVHTVRNMRPDYLIIYLTDLTPNKLIFCESRAPLIGTILKESFFRDLNVCKERVLEEEDEHCLHS